MDFEKGVSAVNIKDLAARDIMHKNVVKVRWSMGLKELATLLQENRITGAPVVDDIDKLIGVVSETDLIRFDSNEPRPRAGEDVSPFFKDSDSSGSDTDLSPEQFDNPEEYKVEDIMTPWTLTAGERTPVTEVARMMTHLHVHRILIVDADSRLVGIISSMDIVAVIAKIGKNATLTS